MADRDELLSHNYDGIEEFDNDLPRWWVWFFWITIIAGVIRVGYYHYGPGKLQEEALVESMAELEEIRANNAPKESLVEITEESLLALVSDAEVLKAGSEVYKTNCAACHLEHGQGLVGPNLCDDYWIHGGSLKDIRRVVVEGVPAKGMIAWKEALSAEQINAVTAYIWTLSGTNPPNPKAAEGELFSRK